MTPGQRRALAACLLVATVALVYDLWHALGRPGRRWLRAAHAASAAYRAADRAAYEAYVADMEASP
jgi:hypothetical protein